MCGFIAAFGEGKELLDRAALRRALERMRRRGPDDEGTWQGEGAVFGHRRLSILDLDHRAAQPMQSICGRYVIAFNGEIYNFRALRRCQPARKADQLPASNIDQGRTVI
jgi:asparagine synthase (glutamine-hydrolysing)